MNEMRHDWLSDRWVIYAPNRTLRPDDYDRSPFLEHESRSFCPFCSGSEQETPEPTLTLPQADWESTRSNRQHDFARLPRNEWLVRVVPNKFPAVTFGPIPFGWAETEASHVCESSQDASTYDTKQACPSLFIKRETAGAHEVIIESPKHVSSITSLTADHVHLVFEAYRQRLAHWRARADMKYAVVFKNFGADAGATLIHSHSQLICTNFVPSDVHRILKRMELYQHAYRHCYVCSVLEQELESDERIVVTSDHFVAICPFASRFPFSVSVLPRRHRSQFEDCTPDEVRDLGLTVQKVLHALESEHPGCAYNYVLQTAPFDLQLSDTFHWRLKVIPRLSKVAGFEWSSDCFINTVFPEHAARSLRNRIQPAPATQNVANLSRSLPTH